MNLDALCVSRRPPQRRKRCLLALLHAGSGGAGSIGNGCSPCENAAGQARRGRKKVCAQARSVEKGAAGKGLNRHTLPEYGLPGRSRAGISRAGHEKRRKPCGIRLWKGTPLPFCAAGAAAAGVAPHRGRRRHDGKAKGQIWSILLLKRSLFQRIILAQNVTFARIHTTWRRQPPWCQQSTFNVKLLYLV